VRAGRPGEDFERDAAWVLATDVEKLRTGAPRTEMGWEIDASGLYDVLTRVARDYDAPPLYVTENGAAFADVVDADGRVRDPQRVEYLDGHFRAAARAIADGVDLRGYFVWTLMDNFEWAWGFARRFGLVHVDHATQRRTVKDSGHWFAGVARANRLPAAGS
jgi:beta-glucosidase